MVIGTHEQASIRDTVWACGTSDIFAVNNNIVVILAWFGVNLLGVGLHSYGFASGIARNILIFIMVELILGFGMYFLAKNRKQNFVDTRIP